MDQLIKWLMQNVHGSQTKLGKLGKNWPWLIVGLIVLIVIV